MYDGIASTISYSYGLFQQKKMSIENMEGFHRFTRSHRDYGVVVGHDGGVKCQEWIPNAKAVFLKGQFSKYKFGQFQSNEGLANLKNLFRIFLFLNNSQKHFLKFYNFQTIGRRSRITQSDKENGNCFFPLNRTGIVHFLISLS